MTSRLSWYGIPVTKAVFTLILSLYIVNFILSKKSLTFKKSSTIYISLCFVIVLFLAFVGAIKGSLFSNIIPFILPLFILFFIPVVYSLIQKYGIDKYFSHILFANVLLAFIVISINILCYKNRNIAAFINEWSGNFKVTYLPFGMRVFAKTGGFFPCGLVLCFYFYNKIKNKKYLIYTILIAYGLYLNHTFTVFFAGITVSFFSLIIITHKRVSRFFYAFFGLIIFFVVVFVYFTKVHEHKRTSINIKIQQSVKAIELLADSPILGKGLGYEYINMDERNAKNVNLEVTYIMLLTSTGFLGFFLYAYVYLHCSVKSIFKQFYNDNAVIAINLMYLGVLIEGTGNPYILSGGMAFLLIAFLAALIEYKQMSRVHNY